MLLDCSLKVKNNDHFIFHYSRFNLGLTKIIARHFPKIKKSPNDSVSYNQFGSNLFPVVQSQLKKIKYNTI